MSAVPFTRRRKSGAYQLQVRLCRPLAESVRLTHLSVSLGVRERAEAARCVGQNMSWIVEFKDSPNLKAAGQRLLNAMNEEIGKGTTSDGSRHQSRAVLEETVRRYIDSSRTAQFNWVGELPGLPDVFRAFIALQDTEAAAKEDWLAQRRPANRAIGVGDGAPQLAIAPTVERLASVVDRLAVLFETSLSQQAPTALASVDALHRELTAFNASAPAASIVQPRSHALAMSQAIDRFLKSEDRRVGSPKNRELLEPILRFSVAFLGDPPLASVEKEAWQRLDDALPHIPTARGFSVKQRADLHLRYRTAQEKGWQGLQRVTITTLDIRYKASLNRFIRWAAGEKLITGDIYRFTVNSQEVNTPLARDALAEADLMRFLQLPLFHGRARRDARWTPGTYFVQDELYWVYLILVFTGMRTGEPPQLRCSDLVEIEGVHYLDLRPFDPAEGRVPIKDVTRLKTGDAARMIPVHPLLIDLGLVERRDELVRRGQDRLFPEWKPSRSKRGVDRWGAPVTKTFEEVRRRVDIKAKNVSAYSLRHLFAEWLDANAISMRTRNRVMGHTDDTNEGDTYGSKSVLSKADLARLTGFENPTIRYIGDLLMGSRQAAGQGRLRLVPLAATMRVSGPPR